MSKRKTGWEAERTQISDKAKHKTPRDLGIGREKFECINLLKKPLSPIGSIRNNSALFISIEASKCMGISRNLARLNTEAKPGNSEPFGKQGMQ